MHLSALILSLLLFNRLAVIAGMSSISKLRQSLNLSAIKELLYVWKHPECLIPMLEIKKLDDLNTKFLIEKNIKCIIFDKDNTLTYTYVDSLHPSVVGKMKNIIDSYKNENVAILSNSVGTCDDDQYKGAIETEKHIGINVIRHLHKKPGCLDEVLSHFNKNGSKNVHPNEICMVGDRLLTDVLFANKYGMMSVLVAPLSWIKDHPIASILRFFEMYILLPLVKLLVGIRKRQ